MSLLSRGAYEAVIESQAFGEIPNDKKTPTFELRVRVDAKIAPASQERTPLVSPEFRTITLFCTPKAIEETKEKLQKTGWPGGGPETLDPNNPGHFSFKGKKVVVWNGADETEANRWGKWNLSTVKAPEPRKSNPHVVSKLAAIWGSAGGSSPATPVPEVPSSFSF